MSSKISRLYRIACTCALIIVLAGCSLYRPDLRQGDHLTQKDLDKLRSGMSKVQVAQVLGTPSLTPVLEIEEWHYTCAFLKGTERDKPLCFETITLYFKEDKLQAYSSEHWQPENLPKR